MVRYCYWPWSRVWSQLWRFWLYHMLYALWRRVCITYCIRCLLFCKYKALCERQKSKVHLLPSECCHHTSSPLPHTFWLSTGLPISCLSPLQQHHHHPHYHHQQTGSLRRRWVGATNYIIIALLTSSQTQAVGPRLANKCSLLMFVGPSRAPLSAYSGATLTSVQVVHYQWNCTYKGPQQCKAECWCRAPCKYQEATGSVQRSPTHYVPSVSPPYYPP